MRQPGVVSIGHYLRRVTRAAVPLIAALVALSFFAFTGGCKKGHTDRIESQTEVLATGTWVVTTYKDTGTYRTEIFSGYTFTFQREGANHGGTVAVAGPENLVGTWQLSEGDSDLETALQLWFPGLPEPDFLSTSLEPLEILSNSSWTCWWESWSESMFVFHNWNSRKWLEISRL